MPPSPLSSGSAVSFGTYEFFRITVPGFYFATLATFFYWTWLSEYFPLNLPDVLMLILFVALAAIAGITLYAKESTKRRRAFLENQPSRFLADKARTLNNEPLLEDDSARRLYFYILNTCMPTQFHEKIFFFGTVYHIVIQIRRTSFWFSALSMAALAFELSRGYTLEELPGLLTFTLTVLLIYVLNVRYNKADRKMQENYQDQIFWLQMNGELVEELIRKSQHVTQRQHSS